MDFFKPNSPIWVSLKLVVQRTGLFPSQYGIFNPKLQGKG